MKDKKYAKTIKEVVSTILFVVLIILILNVLQFITRDKTSSTMFDRFRQLDKDSVSVFFVGNSHSFCSIDTDLLYDRYGLDSFMLSASGQSIAMSYYAIKEACKYQKPETVYLEMSYAVHEWDVINDEMSHMFFDGMPLDSVKIEAVRDLIEEENRLSFYLPMLQFHSRFDSLNKEDYSFGDLSARGRFYSDSIWECEKLEFPEEFVPKDPPENIVKYMDLIVELCRENNIELILYTVPYNPEAQGYNQQYYDDVCVYYGLSEYAAKNNLEYHNLFEEIDEIGIDYSKDFKDLQHFNCYGQEKFTEYMVEKGYISVK